MSKTSTSPSKIQQKLSHKLSSISKNILKIQPFCWFCHNLQKAQDFCPNKKVVEKSKTRRPPPERPADPHGWSTWPRWTTGSPPARPAWPTTWAPARRGWRWAVRSCKRIWGLTKDLKQKRRWLWLWLFLFYFGVLDWGIFFWPKLVARFCYVNHVNDVPQVGEDNRTAANLWKFQWLAGNPFQMFIPADCFFWRSWESMDLIFQSGRVSIRCPRRGCAMPRCRCLAPPRFPPRLAECPAQRPAVQGSHQVRAIPPGTAMICCHVLRLPQLDACTIYTCWRWRGNLCNGPFTDAPYSVHRNTYTFQVVILPINHEARSIYSS